MLDREPNDDFHCRLLHQDFPPPFSVLLRQAFTDQEWLDRKSVPTEHRSEEQGDHYGRSNAAEQDNDQNERDAELP
ncbi:MAG: hypothetical protein EXR98_02500 [Gemmataceae bacterium]|nr:hypothetical protein [Gemmataceae bacterium]